MLDSSARRITEQLGPSDRVLDVGAGLSPFARADWVIDLLPYEDRGAYAYERSDQERFSAATWVLRDICERRPWPFEDRQFEYAICSHTLEDVRDPVWVCSEIMRVARAGYVEVPSRLEEQSWGVHGPWVGWSHHHWLCDVSDQGIEFVFKPHVLHGRESQHFARGFHSTLGAEQRVQRLWWTDRFSAEERIFGDGAALDRYLEDFVRTHQPPAPSARRGLRRLISR